MKAIRTQGACDSAEGLDHPRGPSRRVARDTVIVEGDRRGPIAEHADGADVIDQRIQRQQFVAITLDHVSGGAVVPLPAVPEGAGTFEGPGDDVQACFPCTAGIARCL